MKHINLKRIFFTSILAFSLNSNSSELKAELNGAIDFKAGLKNNRLQPKEFDEDNNLSKNRKNSNFSSSASIVAKLSNTLDNGFEYGAELGLAPTANNSNLYKSYIYTKTHSGTLEFGSNKSAMSKMRITPATISAASGGPWDSWSKVDPSEGQRNSFLSFVTKHANFTDAKLKKKGQAEFSRKITYYTPEFSGFQLGISYIPDSANLGSASISEDGSQYKSSSAELENYHLSVKDGFAGGVTYKTDLSDECTVSFSAVGEVGTVKARLINENDENNPSDSEEVSKKINNLRNYSLGAMLKYNNFSVAASYGNYNKSLETKATSDDANIAGRIDTKNSTKVYGIGFAYEHKDLKTSVNLFRSHHKYNNLTSATFGVNYLLAPGLSPYAEFSVFEGNHKKLAENDENFKNKGTVFVIGTKLTF